MHTRKNILRWTLLLFTVSIFAACGSSRRSIGIEEGWDLLAETKVNFVRDKDEILVNSQREYTTLRFKVEGRDVRLNDLKIYFQNGDKLEPNLDATINADQFSRDIDLARDGRIISRVEFKYRTTGNVLKGRARVILLGKRRFRDY